MVVPKKEIGGRMKIPCRNCNQEFSSAPEFNSHTIDCAKSLAQVKVASFTFEFCSISTQKYSVALSENEQPSIQQHQKCWPTYDTSALKVNNCSFTDRSQNKDLDKHILALLHHLIFFLCQLHQQAKSG